LNVIMAGIDYTLAPIDIREKFSFTKSTLQAVYNDLLKNENIFGAVIVSTCNRTELYLSCEEGLYINPFELLCDAANFDYEEYSNMHVLRTGVDVIRHLCELACGVKSQIWGEDQIITQVRNAIELAREMNASDSTLEVMFRIAVTSAKKVKTTLKLSSTERSIAYSALKYVVYKNIDFGKGAASFKARVASATSGGNIELRIDSIDGPVVGICPVAGSGGWQQWVDATCEVSGLKGVHDLYLKFTGGSGYLLNINWFTFVEGNNDENLGDLNDDGKVNSTDLQILKKHLLRITLLTGKNLSNADLNKDGKVDSSDLSLMKRYLLQIIPTF